jgi:hypothetical protein
MCPPPLPPKEQLQSIQPPKVHGLAHLGSIPVHLPVLELFFAFLVRLASPVSEKFTAFPDKVTPLPDMESSLPAGPSIDKIPLAEAV